LKIMETSAADPRRGLLEQVVDRFESPLLRYASGIVGDHALAQDAVQEAFVALSSQWRRGHAPGSDDHLRNWLYKVTHDKAVSILRAERTRTRAHEGYAREAAIEADCAGGDDCEVSRETKLQILAESLDALIPSRRQVLLLRLQQGLGHDSIAAITGHSVTHCRKLLHEAVKILNAEVARRLQSREGMRHE
jgi:RNA polymerase sigma-70 factor (ECF subfamily)